MFSRRLCILVFLLILPLMSFAAEPAHSFGLVFEMKNLLLTIDPYTDGYQAGAGVKWWPAKNLALRGLVGANLNVLAGAATAQAGVSAALEYHLALGRISPYLGALAGLRLNIAAENSIDLYAGAIGGAEMSIWENISAYAEYGLLMSLDANGFTLDLGQGAVQVGLIVYLK